MQISLINGFYIETDNRNFTLKKKYIGTRKDGTKKEAVKIHGRYGSLEQALEAFLKLYQIDRGARFAVDLMSYADFINGSNKEAVRALKSVLEGNIEKLVNTLENKVEMLSDAETDYVKGVHDGYAIVLDLLRDCGKETE